MGCTPQMAPAQGKCLGIHIKAAGFNYQLALWGREVPGACPSPPVLPFTRLDVASQCQWLGLGAAKGARGCNTLRIPPAGLCLTRTGGKKLILGHFIFIESLDRAQGPWLNQWGCICPSGLYLPINLPSRYQDPHSVGGLELQGPLAASDPGFLPYFLGAVHPTSLGAQSQPAPCLHGQAAARPALQRGRGRGRSPAKQCAA